MVVIMILIDIVHGGGYFNWGTLCPVTPVPNKNTNHMK